jgi:tRNA-2-methylthio-N6-dimethylallyladenosine synthase
VKRRRNNELLALQNRISAEVGQEFVGQRLDVFVQGVSKKQAKAARAKSSPGAVGLTIAGKAVGSVDGHAHHQDHDHDHGQGACSTHASHVHAADSTTTSTGAHAGVQMSGRTEGDLIVFFDLPTGKTADDLIGSIVPVRIERSMPLALIGSVE